MAQGADAFGAAEQAALVEEAARKSAVVWVNGRALWHVWREGAVWVVGDGAGEQPLPGLADGGTASVAVRSKDKGGRLAVWRARTELVPPGGEAWEAAVAELKAKRLNSADADGVTARWAEQCRVFRLVAQELPSEHPGARPDGSGAASPVPSPAITRRPIPAALPRLLRGRRKRDTSTGGAQPGR